MTGIPKSKVVTAGARLHSFVFVRYTQSRFGNAYGIFRCDFCEEERERVVSQVRTGYVKTCHCRNRERNTRHGHAASGLETPTYEAWAAMKKRCLNPRHANFASYGGRGISVCDRWMAFEAFLADMGERPAGMSIDRIDNDGDYSPTNCRWATISEQNNNRRGNTMLSFNGESRTISQWAAATGIKDCTLSERLRKGWSVEKALTTPARMYARAHERVPPAAT